MITNQLIFNKTKQTKTKIVFLQLFFFFFYLNTPECKHGGVISVKNTNTYFYELAVMSVL